jgi:hypothetical protein
MEEHTGGESPSRKWALHGASEARSALAPNLNHLADQLVLGSNTLITLCSESRGV